MFHGVTFVFQSPSKWRFQCNIRHGVLPVSVISHFQSPSKWRFQCNTTTNYQYSMMQETFSLLVNGDFNVTEVL